MFSAAAVGGGAHSFDFTLVLMPGRTAVAERILEEQGVLGDVALRWVVLIGGV